ncbi:MAG: M20/M25/M40 family metallo-hydrolase [Nannocystaceae bacterium]|nr:M20/M25/M40 family metallo-hydrolase [bacterium]
MARWTVLALLCAGLFACGDDASSGATEGGTTASGTDVPMGTSATGVDTTTSAGPTSDPMPGSESDSGSSETTATDPTGPDVPTIDCDTLAESIDAESLMAHLAQLQAIGDAHGNRSVGTPGYVASADYVRARLQAAGYDTAVDQDFDVTVFEELSPPSLSASAPLDDTYAVEEDFVTARYSGSGTVTAPVVPIDINLSGNNQNNSGCQPEDFDGFPPGAIALIQRGSCTFVNKVNRAIDNGASGVILFNQGGNDNQQDPLSVGIDPDNPDNPPTVFTSYAVGAALAGATGVEATITVDGLTEVRTTRNVLVERVGTDAEQVVMFGAHLDSVPAGPGINDNGTGSMALLAIAERLAQCDPARTVRFAWWGAEEIGLLGSAHYVQTLADSDRASLMFYLNFDMIGSPNFVRFVHDGDGSRYGNAGPEGSDALEQFFADHFDALGLPVTEARFDGRSDYGPFLDAGIPTGGLFTGAEGNKSGQETRQYGGTQGEAYDPCYHLACDVDGNIAVEEYARVATAVATAVQRFGIDGEGLFSAYVGPRPLATASAPSGPAGCGHALTRE